ncbi:IclR family transcriptional regulator [Marinobacterium aestuariivivens]|uniref:IclR family transcriptional regulator n=1 Tax=Marinobacterium aestuariivivens TaxID=1698799 RepID=A0ABW2A784_9GAMM
MAASQITRALSVIEQLALEAQGLGLQAIADGVPMPKSSCQRLLNDLIQQGYVAWDAHRDRYQLTTRLAALSQRHLSVNGVDDPAQPHLDQLAEICGDLVRLAVVDGDRLVFAANAQGARSGLRYQAPAGEVPPLFCTATGFAWLAGFSDDDALKLIAAQGPMDPENRGPRAPQSFAEILPLLQLTRERGYSQVIDMSAPGMSAIAAPVTDAAGAKVIGVLAIGGPTARLTETLMNELAPFLQQTARDISAISVLSDYLRRPPSAR